MSTTRKQRPPSLSTTIKQVGQAIESPTLDIYEYDSPTFAERWAQLPDSERDDEMPMLNLTDHEPDELKPDTPGRAARSLSTSCFGVPIKYLSLGFLIVQNSTIAMLMRQSRASPAERLFLPSTVVVSSEVVKVIAATMLMFMGGFQKSEFTWWEVGKSAVPSVLFVFVNNLAFVAISNLEAATYQLTYQVKIFTTAVMSVLILKKSISLRKWLSLVVLAGGVVVVQWSPTAAKKEQIGNPLIGLMAAVGACCLSSIANVYFEKILKDSPVTLWARNVHLGVIGIATGLVGIYLSGETQLVMEKGFFYGYTWLTWAVVMCASLGGLLSAVVVKYADNILKGFATSFAIVLTCLFSTFFFGFVITPQFVIGGFVVNFAIFIYTKPTATETTNEVSPMTNNVSPTTRRSSM